ncbi:MAG: DsrE family protein [Phycisphaerales bacterium]|nr:MAG: DsrE family protein [Phycisphaerales bacterium]
MKNRNMVLAVVVLLAGCMAGQRLVDARGDLAEPSKLGVLWTSGDPDVAHKVCLMYTHAAKRAKWFDEVVLIVWGPSSRLLAADKELQAKVKAMMAGGVVTQACVVCADMYGVSDDLREMGIEVKPMGKPLSDMLKSDWKVLTF